MESTPRIPPPAPSRPTPSAELQAWVDSAADAAERRYRRWRELASLVAEARRRAEAVIRLDTTLAQRR